MHGPRLLSGAWGWQQRQQRAPASTHAPHAPSTAALWCPACSKTRHTSSAACSSSDTTAGDVDVLDVDLGSLGAPWSINPYYTKQKHRTLGELGQILESPDSVEEPFGWTQDTKLKLSIQVVSRELGRPEEEVAQQLELLRSLLPDLELHLGNVKAADLVRLASDLAETAEKLLVLRDALPLANISCIVAGNLRLLHMSREQLESNMKQVAALLGYHPQWQALLEHSPFLADAEQLSSTLSEISRLFGSSLGAGGPAALLISSPDLALSCQDLKPQGGNNTD